jgi:16S rRNA (adenine1518-N6/adenine1519-N6)-dimethyltransferase
MRAKKSLGQHFLRSQKALNQIIAAGDIQATDLVLEIGPGEGVLTELLVEKAQKVIAIEKDESLTKILKEVYQKDTEAGKLEIMSKDILDFDPEKLREYGSSYKLIANIPYYITGAIIEKFLSVHHQPERIVLLIQKEVAERIVARDGKESIYSIAVKAYGVPTLIAKVPAGAFAPAPTVDSAILCISGINRSFFVDCNETLFFRVLKAVFGKKRKQIGGSLSDFLGDRELALQTLNISGINPKARPEDLALGVWKKLTQSLPNGENSVQ